MTVTGSTKVSELESGKITTYYLDPEDFGFERCLEEKELKVRDRGDRLKNPLQAL
jgi:anthranilate phosphoribosyltransferase